MINKKGADHVQPSDGDANKFKHWKETMEDHISEDWHKWRLFNKEAVSCPGPISVATLKSIKLKGFSA